MMSSKWSVTSFCYGVLVVKTLLCRSIITTAQSDDNLPIMEAPSSLVSCVCGPIRDRPDIWDKVATARWMVHNIDWGVLTTISSRTTNSSGNVIPFGNIYSFVDGSCSNSTGIPYFYGTYMDQSLQDMIHNPIASFTLSEASIDTSCLSSPPSTKNHPNPIRQACRIAPETYNTKSHHHGTHTVSSGDPESPICARLTLTGVLEVVPMYSAEYNTTLYEGFHPRHPQMSHWPIDHNWIIFKLNITQYDIWLINYFGGATVITPEEYFQYDFTTTMSSSSSSDSDAIAENDPV